MNPTSSPHPPDPEKDNIAGYAPVSLVKAPLRPPQATEVRQDVAVEKAKALRQEHNAFGLALVMVGIGLIAIVGLLLLFMAEAVDAVVLWLLGVLGVFGIIAGLAIDAIYRASYGKTEG